MLEIYDTIERITNPETAKAVVTILIDYFNFYITTEELQQLHIK